MAKALKNWELESPLGSVRIKFAQFTTKIIDKTARLIPDHEPMDVSENYFISGDIYDLETKKFESKGKIAVKSIDAVKYDEDHVIYYAESTENVRYYFDLWQSTYGMKQDLIKSWLKGVRPENIKAFLR